MEIDIEKCDYTSILPFTNEYLNEFPEIAGNITYNDFFTNYIMKNQPCIIKNVANEWESTNQWIFNGRVNFGYLSEKYGNENVSLYDCKKKYCICHEYKFKDFIKYWSLYECGNDSCHLPLHYLKDWHLKNKFPKDNFYEVPIYFSSDWINEYLVSCSLDDYRFVYMGPKGSW